LEKASETFNQLIIKLIDVYNIKQKEIAENIGVKPLKISNIKRGMSTADQYLLEKLYKSYPFLKTKEEVKNDSDRLQLLQQIVSLQKENAALRKEAAIEREELERMISLKVQEEFKKINQKE